MRKLVALLLSTAAVFAGAPASAQYTPPLGERPAVAGPRTQMLNLGSVHLSSHGDWQRTWLAPLNAKLVAWQPQVVTVESLSGAQCELMRQVPQRYAEAYEHYCPDATGFQRALKTTQAEAERDAAAVLAEWPASPTPAQRRRLAMLFLAAGDRPSAQVQWLRLAVPERIAEDGLTEAALKVLDRSQRAMNESYDIAAAVAAASGLERIHAVDDHTAVVLGDAYPEGFADWQRTFFQGIRDTPRFAAMEAAWSAVDDGDSLLAAYRDMNAPGAQDAQIRADFGGAFADAAPERFGRYYAGWWETRNLRMVANIREAITPHPGARVLNIVGASHKPWYDQWARQMADVEVVDAREVLGD
ncbi:DUF5694 domain-containing protein [Luteimonas arsenica]|uniref:DUF5694 domain-containing protein n=1 Tax=Luteimonas arsenica TaxID=1586242 RepID=UPI001056140C|nr:DUF5694 domain-containing protein [Luteimonas arsenica]